MPQIDRLLTPGEHVHLISREHGVVLLAPFLRAAAIVALCATGAILAAGLALPAAVRLIPVLVAAAAAARALVGLVGAVARWQRQVLVVTDSRAVLLAGGLGRRAAIVSLSAISEIEVVRSAPGRTLHYGGVVVRTGGRRGPLFGLRRLPDPDLLLGLLLGLAEDRATQRQWAAAVPASSVLR
jgi:hypothetical protein